MKILYLNNYHYIRGGSERVYFEEAKLMREHGHSTCFFSRVHPNNIECDDASYFPEDINTSLFSLSRKSLTSILSMFYSLESKRCLSKLLSKQFFNIAHAHNIYGRLSTSVLDELKNNGIPVVMTLHDYKIICPNYQLMRDGRICEDCKGERYYNCLMRRCYKGSMAASILYTLETYFNEYAGKYKNNVKILISPSKFLRTKIIEFGWPEKKIMHVPNFLNLDEYQPAFSHDGYLLYLGRLSLEKGVGTLIKAFKQIRSSNARLVIAGDGPLRESLQRDCLDDDRISFAGYLQGDNLVHVVKRATALILPSEWYENAPMSLLEAFAYGKPVVGANIGGIPELIEHGKNGFLFTSGNSEDLFDKLQKIFALSMSEVALMGRMARATVESGHSAKVHFERLMDVYQMASEGVY